MILKTNNGDREIKVKELDFTNLMCDLEDNGVDIMALMDEENQKNLKVFSMMRAILGVLIGERDLQKAGKVLSEHIKNGGSLDDIMNIFTEAMAEAGFGAAAEETQTEAEQQMVLPMTETESTSQNTEVSQK